MKGMKKAIALALSAVLLCATVLVNNVVSVKAAPTAEFAAEASSTDVKQGAEFTVTVKLTSNTEGVAAFAGKLYFNKEKLSVVDASGNDKLSTKNNDTELGLTLLKVADSNKKGYVGFSAAEADSDNSTGTLFIVPFKVNDDAELSAEDIRLDIESAAGGAEGSTPCTAAGNTVTINIVSACDHVLDNGVVTKEPTCTEKGTKTFTCTICKKVVKTEDVDTIAHTSDAGTVTTDPTCQKEGVKTFKCTVCKQEIGTEPVSMVDCKSDEGTVTTQPTCKDKGVKTFKCVWCGKVLNTEDVEKTTTHTKDEGTVTKNPTCTEPGVKSYKCSVCETDMGTEPVSPLGHKFDNGTVTTQPTCTEAGVKTFKCTNTGCTETKTEPVKKLDHVSDNGTVTTQPTCTEAGVKTFKCTACKTVLDTQPVEALGHSFGEFVVVKEPTEKEEGLMRATCGRCNLVKEVKIPVLPATEMIDMNTGMPAASEYPVGSDIGVMIPEIGVPASPVIGDVCYIPTKVNGAPYTADTKLDTSKAGALEVNVVYTANVFDGKNWVSTGVNKETKITVNIVAPKENTEEPKKETNPNTGDSANIALLLSILAASAATVVVASRKRKDA